ncbi:hypothetical protein P7K49_012199 [Saguinus oedipus]|uniref:Beta-N-acetylhexosaminidase n=1 Tax=Saguinus oedipus TaxID=9490 RepID=A0ABQ9VT28_SAGOE|nr:hypothetical protein P7K49_012199 [Saguinus oedipus]
MLWTCHIVFQRSLLSNLSLFTPQIFPLFRALGANGLLIEYEDMFPYEGPLRLLRAKYAYSPSEIKEILHLAGLNELEVIPLVQTFGHMEVSGRNGSYLVAGVGSRDCRLGQACTQQKAQQGPWLGCRQRSTAQHGEAFALGSPSLADLGRAADGAISVPASSFSSCLHLIDSGPPELQIPIPSCLLVTSIEVPTPASGVQTRSRPATFVLKHAAFAHLREVGPFPCTLNPHEAESLALVGAMIDQVLELHPGAKRLHIGCDEVDRQPAEPNGGTLVSDKNTPVGWAGRGLWVMGRFTPRIGSQY